MIERSGKLKGPTVGWVKRVPTVEESDTGTNTKVYQNTIYYCYHGKHAAKLE